MTSEPATSFEATLQRIEARLATLLPAADGRTALNAAMAESVLAPGKRLRPLMTVIVAEDLGADIDGALDLGCALEMIHTASLILDDLPCMDDADLRRGLPAMHVRHGEDAAVLASVALLSHAYGVAAAAPGLSAEARLECIGILSRAVGVSGLVAGQFDDLRGGRAQRPLGEIDAANALKTGALFAAAVEMGALAAGIRRPELAAFAEEIGQAFQLLDDLLDGEPGSGKTPGRDEGKSTVVSLIGRTPVRHRIERHLQEAHIHLEAVFGPASRLGALTDRVLARNTGADRDAIAVLEQEAGVR